ncbi:transmembrane protein 18 isoform X2 [Rhipicephalus microplus]|uniref:transmembrane protein 18 isoform X2 n=1 Tax=Rhipicephalus microplus TaxID=6941 RepID=UPI003F6C39C8
MASVERFSDTMVFPGDTLNIGSLIFQVDWTEPWLMCLVTFHIATFSLTLLTRDRGNVQAVLFMIALLLVYFSEALNDLAARHWQAFSSQQYFDSQGMFISLVFSTPLLLNCIIMVKAMHRCMLVNGTFEPKWRLQKQCLHPVPEEHIEAP